MREREREKGKHRDISGRRRATCEFIHGKEPTRTGVVRRLGGCQAPTWVCTTSAHGFPLGPFTGHMNENASAYGAHASASRAYIYTPDAKKRVAAVGCHRSRLSQSFHRVGRGSRIILWRDGRRGFSN